MSTGEPPVTYDMFRALERIKELKDDNERLRAQMSTADAQRQVAEAITARGYDAGWKPEALMARQVAKAQEELNELLDCFSGLTLRLSVTVRDAGQCARYAFDDGQAWNFASLDDSAQARHELTDLVVTALKLASLLEFDVCAEAVKVSLANVARGVRAG